MKRRTNVSALVMVISGKASLIAFLKREITVEIKELPSAMVAIVNSICLSEWLLNKMGGIFGKVRNC